MITLRRYNPTDYMSIQKRKFDLFTFLNLPKPEAMAQQLAKGPAYTLLNGDPIICGGILPLWAGVGEGWVITSNQVEKYRVTVARHVLIWMHRIANTLRLERVQTLVDADNVVAQKWVERMGFENEGLMTRYLNGHDFFRYAWIREI